jgi:hypothetical protein
MIVWTWGFTRKVGDKKSRWTWRGSGWRSPGNQVVIIEQVGTSMDGHLHELADQERRLSQFHGVPLMGMGASALTLATKPCRRSFMQIIVFDYLELYA